MFPFYFGGRLFEASLLPPRGSPRVARPPSRPPTSLPQDVRAKHLPGPLLGKGAYGLVLGAVERTTKTRCACKSLDVKSLLKTRDGPNIIARLRNEIGVMGYLAGGCRLDVQIAL